MKNELKKGDRNFISKEMLMLVNYICIDKKLISFGENVVMDQKCIFDGAGKVEIGNNVVLGYPLAPHFHGFYELIQARSKYSKITIGNETIFSNDITIIANEEIWIGTKCLIGDRVTMIDHDAHEINPLTRRNSAGSSKPIIIGNNVWIGSLVTILKGVSIGNNSIVAANSVVTKDVPDNVIVAGNPAKVIRMIIPN